MDEYFTNQIYGFALSGGTEKILYKLRQIDCSYLVYQNNIEHYLNMLLHDQPPYILGLGTYSGVDQEKIRLETTCTNQFRNDYIGTDEQKRIKLNYFLSENQQIKIAERIGNSHCNLISWKIMQLINQKKLNSKYTFLHIPRDINFEEVVQIIDKELADFKLKK